MTSSNIISRLIEAAKPFAELLEYPDECAKGVAIDVEIYPEDVQRLRDAISSLKEQQHDR